MIPVDLVQKKVRLLSVMAGSFATDSGRLQAEYNVKMDVVSAQSLFADCPTPIAVSGVEIGLAAPFPADSIERDFACVAHIPWRRRTGSISLRRTVAHRGI
jgi:hypothetical protein